MDRLALTGCLGAPEIQSVQHGARDFVSNRWLCTNTRGLSWGDMSNVVKPKSSGLRRNDWFGDSCSGVGMGGGGERPVGGMALPGTGELDPFEGALGNVLLRVQDLEPS